VRSRDRESVTDVPPMTAEQLIMLGRLGQRTMKDIRRRRAER